jgi:5-methylcytosine-specific restriction enzyme subunit McrC
VDIPIQNIYYLLCYAWDKLDEKEVVDVDPINSTSLADLFARVLISGTNHLLKRGFDRGYIEQQEWTGRLRGRICFQEAIRKNSMRTGTLPCSFDELSYDVLHNQILKATMKRLIRTQGLAAENSEGLAQLCRMFSEIRDIELTSRVFGRVQLYQNNQFYDFLLKVCELIHRNLLVSEKSGNGKFVDFVRDEQQMRMLFENFIRTFYKIHTNYSVKRENIYWRWVAASQFGAGLLPKMQTDISLSSTARKIIIDCKFTPEATKRHYEAEKLRSQHLYQINAYLTNLPEGKSGACEMMLLYPTVDLPLTVDFTDGKHKIKIRTINLNQTWQAIHEDLLVLVS